MINDLLESISKQLNIQRTADNEWICQIAYSVAGQMALASLWDYTDGSASISIQHFKKRMSQVFDAYEDIYPPIRHLLPKEKSVLLDEIYSIYLRTGFLYHSAYQLYPAVQLQASCGSLTVFRNPSPDAKLFMSGLGYYLPQKSQTEGSTIVDIFGLQAQDFEAYLNELLACNEWEPIVWPENTEFLRLDPPFSWGYWQQTPDKTSRISIARYGEPNKILAFCRYNNGAFQQKPIPEWRLRDWFSGNTAGSGEYRRIAIALLKRYNTLPAIKVKTMGSLKEVKVGYRFPPSEEDFFKLYSWPVRYDFSSSSPQVFTRRMALQLYPMFKQTMECLGYTFLEE